jgi:hypothetical protein
MTRSRWIALIEYLDPGPPRLLLLLAFGLCVALFVLQAGTLKAPISGEHNWRQADTYSTAYNFAFEKADFFHPRIDWSRGRSGVMGMETPTYQYVAGLLMRIFGESTFGGRFVNWILLMGAFAAVGISFRLTPRDWRARSLGEGANPLWLPIGIATFAVLSPLVFFEGRQFQPDPAMAALTAIAASFFHTFAKRERPALYAMGAVIYCLAVMTKSPALVAGPAMWMLTFSATPRLRWYQPILRGLPLLVPLVLYRAWDNWAHYLNTAFAGGEAYFAIDLHWDDYLHRIHDPTSLKRFFWFVLPSYSSNWVMFPVLATGLALAFRKGLRAVSVPMFIWLAMGCSLCAGMERLEWHWYYTFLFMLPLVYFGGVGMAVLFEGAAAYRDTTLLVRWGTWFMALALLATNWASGGEKHLEGVLGASQPLGNVGWTSEDGFFALFVLQLVGLALATLFPPGSGQWAARIAIAASCYVAFPRAVYDLTQIFDWRSRRNEWQDFDTDWKELRRAVDEVSTRNDGFVVDGANPWFLYLVRRRGFAQFASQLDEPGVPFFTNGGARFYVHFTQNGALARSIEGRKPMRSGPRWEIFCIDPHGCGS